jgi:hypothetical protein
MPRPVPDSPVTRGFAAVHALTALTNSPDLTVLFIGQAVEDARHRAAVLAEIHRHLDSRKGQGRGLDPWENDLERFVPILELVPVSVPIETATDDTPAPRYFGGY